MLGYICYRIQDRINNMGTGMAIPFIGDKYQPRLVPSLFTRQYARDPGDTVSLNYGPSPHWVYFPIKECSLNRIKVETSQGES